MQSFFERPILGWKGTSAVFVRIWTYSIASVPVSLLIVELLLTIFGRESLTTVLEEAFKDLVVQGEMPDFTDPVTLFFTAVILVLFFFFMALLEEISFRGWLAPPRLRLIGMPCLIITVISSLLLMMDAVIESGYFEIVALAGGLSGFALFIFGLVGAVKGRPDPSFLATASYQLFRTIFIASGLFALIHLANYTAIAMPLVVWPLLVVSQFISGICYAMVRMQFGIMPATFMHTADNIGIILFSLAIGLGWPLHLLSLPFFGLFGLAGWSIVKDVKFYLSRKSGTPKS